MNLKSFLVLLDLKEYFKTVCLLLHVRTCKVLKYYASVFDACVNLFLVLYGYRVTTLFYLPVKPVVMYIIIYD